MSSDNAHNETEVVAKNITFLRTVLGLGPKEFSEEIDVKPNSLWRWEKGQAQPQLANLRAILQLWNSRGTPRLDVIALTTVDLGESEAHYTTRDSVEPSGAIGIMEGGVEWGFESFKVSEMNSLKLRLTVDELNYIQKAVDTALLQALSWRGLEEIVFAMRLMRGGHRQASE